MANITLDKGDSTNILYIYKDDETQAVPWEEILKHWRGDKNTVNNLGAFIQGNGIIGWATYPNGMSGVIFVWNMVEKKIVHVSEGSYTRKALIYGNVVFSLREIPRKDTSELMLCYSPLNTMDADNKKLVNAANLGITIFDKRFKIENYKLAVKDRMIVAGFRNNVKQIKLVTPEEVAASQQARNNIEVTTNPSPETEGAAENSQTENPQE